MGRGLGKLAKAQIWVPAVPRLGQRVRRHPEKIVWYPDFVMRCISGILGMVNQTHLC